ncbi:MFS transporter [Xenorhabdus szentirmaii]|uniref:MFS transporter n=1 Tax=Xenorhabdus szentirmaii TaxID=290112 RepID=UPI002B417AC3|nr:MULTISPECIES: MFS transporter [unclassified Xenorhabdus]
MALSSIGIFSLMLPLLIGPTLGWPVWCWGLFLFAFLMLLQFVRHEKAYAKRGKVLLFDLILLKNKRFGLGCLLILFIYSTSSSLFLVLALFLQKGLGFNALEAGLIFAPASIGFVLSSLSAPYWIKRFGNHVLTIGTLLYVISFIALMIFIAILPPTSSSMAFPLFVGVVPILLLLGYGQGFIMTPLLNVILAFVHVRFAGMASGVIATLQQIGAAFGVAVVGVFIQKHINNVDPISFLAYQNTFVQSMLYNVFAIFVVCYLLKKLLRTENLAQKNN